MERGNGYGDVAEAAGRDIHWKSDLIILSFLHFHVQSMGDQAFISQAKQLEAFIQEIERLQGKCQTLALETLQQNDSHFLTYTKADPAQQQAPLVCMDLTNQGLPLEEE